MPHIVERSRGPKRKVVVVGAGPAGLEAARVAKLRGHEVVLFEKNPEVGGQVMIAAKAPQREQMSGIIRWFDMETRRLGVDRRLGVAADEKMIMAEKPDIVVLATGGSSLHLAGAGLGRGRRPCRQFLGHPDRQGRAREERAAVRRREHPRGRRRGRLHGQPRLAGGDRHARREGGRRLRRHHLPDLLPAPLCLWRDPHAELHAGTASTRKTARPSRCCATSTRKSSRSARSTRW